MKAYRAQRRRLERVRGQDDAVVDLPDNTLVDGVDVVVSRADLPDPVPADRSWPAVCMRRGQDDVAVVESQRFEALDEVLAHPLVCADEVDRDE